MEYHQNTLRPFPFVLPALNRTCDVNGRVSLKKLSGVQLIVAYSGNPALLQGCPGGCWFDGPVLRDSEYNRGTGCAGCGPVYRTSGSVRGAPGNRRSYRETDQPSIPP